MASHHLLTSRRPRSDLLVDRDVPPVEFDRHHAAGPGAAPGRSVLIGVLWIGRTGSPRSWPNPRWCLRRRPHLRRESVTSFYAASYPAGRRLGRPLGTAVARLLFDGC
jgi:hypothetical protein